MTHKNHLFKTCAAAALMAGTLSASAFTTPQMRLAHPQTRAADQDDKYETILYEDFSKWSEGTPDAPDGTMYPINYFTDFDKSLPSDMFMTPGDYIGTGCYQAGGCVALNYPGMGGFINFPTMEMSGKLILTARVKAIGEKRTSFAITILTGDAASPTSVENDGGANGLQTVTNADGWIDIRREIINPYSDPCWLQINAMMHNATGIVVDWVKIERDRDFLSAPMQTGTGKFTNEGFTASWQPNPKAKSYLISLYEKTPVDGKDHMAFEDFENAAIDETTGEIPLQTGWRGDFGFSFDGNIATEPDDVFEGNKSIRLHNNDRLSFFLDNTLVKDISMAFLANVADKGNNELSLRVIPFTKHNPDDNDYSFYWTLRPSNLDDGWNWVQMSEFFDDFQGGYTRVDLMPEGLKEGEYMIIDNLCAVTEPLTETACIIEDATAEEASYTFSGLDMAKTFYFTVKAKNSSCTSEPSAQTYVIGVGAPEVKEATELDKRGAFTANWNPAVNATSYTLNCYESRAITDALPDFPVFTEDFSKAQGGEDGNYIFLNNMYFVELDSYADNEGWGGSGTLVGDGMVGCYMMDVYGQLQPFEMVSPAIDLSHDNGKFKVNVDFMIQNEGEILVIQCDNSNYMGIHGAEPNKMTHASVELAEGTPTSKLMLYALGSTPFMLDKIEVTQNYSTGDEILTKVDFKELPDGNAASGRISGLERKDGITYVYDVVSHRDHYGLVYDSEPSEKMRVDLYNAGIEETGTSGEDDCKVFDIEGRRITGKPAPGLYIMVKGGKARKVIVK